MDGRAWGFSLKRKRIEGGYNDVPRTKSAEKRVRTNERRQLRNRAAKAALKTGLNRVKRLIEGKDAEALRRAGPQVMSLIGKTLRKGAINWKRAARLKSRLQGKINAVLASATATSPQ